MATDVQQLSKALELHQAGQAGDAKAIYQQVIHDDPVCVDAHHLIGLLLHEEGDDSQALVFISKAIELCPGNPTLLNSRGVVEMSASMLDRAATSFHAAISLDPHSAEAHQNLGAVNQQLGRFDLAIQHLTAALQLDPSNPNIYLKLGEIAVSQNDLWDAEAFFRHAISHGDDRLAPISLGHVLNQQGRASDVPAILAPVASQYPDDFECQIQLGIAFGRLNRHEDAMKHLTHCIELRPNSDSAHYLASVSLLMLNRLRESLVHAEFVNRQTNSVVYRLHHARVLGRLKRFKESCDSLRSLYQEYPNDLAILEALADAETRCDNKTIAIDLYQQIIESDPTLRTPLFKLARICEQDKKIDTTVQCCVRVLTQDPNSVGAHMLLGLALSSRLSTSHRAKLDLQERRDLSQRALEHLSRAATLEPSAETFEAWGKTLIGLGRHAEALDRIETALKFDPTFARAYESLGRACLETGNLERAQSAFEKAIEFVPSSSQAHFEWDKWCHPPLNGTNGQMVPPTIYRRLRFCYSLLFLLY